MQQIHLIQPYIYSDLPIKNMKPEKGLTLVEIMVAITLSAIVLAAILINVSSASRSSASQKAYSQMMENGQFALGLLSKSIRNAGYYELFEVPSSIEDRARFGQYLLGCSNQGISTSSATLPDWGASCSTSGDTDSIAIRYQGGQLTQAPALTSGTAQADSLDCAGQKVTAGKYTITRTDGTKATIVDNRFYINNNTLTCWGNGAETGWALVPNIEEMRLSYGVSERITDSAGFTTLAGVTSRYLTAKELEKKFKDVDAPEDYWERVTAVRVCIVVRSTNFVPATDYSYTNCYGSESTPTDGHLRKAMFTTVEVANTASGL